jgi:carboxyl-terminal processing protease
MSPVSMTLKPWLPQILWLGMAAWSGGICSAPLHAQTSRLGRESDRPRNPLLLRDDEPTPRRVPWGDSRPPRGGATLRVIRENAFETDESLPRPRWDAPSLNRDLVNTDGFGLGSPESWDGHGQRRRDRSPPLRSSPRMIEETPSRITPLPNDTIEPVNGSEVWRGHLAPAQELISRRYSDPQLLPFISTITPPESLALYQETLELIAARHLDPAPPSRLVQRGLFNLVEALRNPTFQQAARLAVDPGHLPDFEQQLVQMFQQSPIRTPVEATQMLQLVMQAAQQSLGLNPVLVALEFEYGAIESLDQFSALVPPTNRSGSSGNVPASAVGIGVQVQVAAEGLRIVRTLAGSPARQAGLQAQDLIIAVDGQSLAGRDLNSATALITGPEGTQVTLSVLRGNSPPAALAISRQRLEVRSVSDAGMLTAETAYLRLDTFAATSSQEIQQALQTLANQGMRNLVFDLRGNPGGLLTTAIEIGRLFIKEGTVVSTRGRTPEDNTTEPGADGATWNLPLALLVDEDSASASEILAAAIQENKRGVIVGTQTYGKGTVQTLFPLKSLGVALRLTTAQFYSPRGRAMAGEGVRPDIPVAGDVATQGTPSDLPLVQAISAVNQAMSGPVSSPLVRGQGVRNSTRSFRPQTGQKE